MIVKILYAQNKDSRGSFSAVIYNTSKIDKNKGELMKTSNFDSLIALGKIRPQDYINYFETLSANNRNVKHPQLHAVISAKGSGYDKHSLTGIAEEWLKEMGYGKQPYLLVFHKDTANNHIHMVSARVDRDGKKINSAFEKRRAISSLHKVLGYDFGFQYKFSTRAQFLTILEHNGYPGNDPDQKKIEKRIAEFILDKERTAQIKAILEKTRHDPDLIQKLKQDHRLDLVFHAAEGKKPYGYTIIDNEFKTVYKGSEVLALKELFAYEMSLARVSTAENPDTADLYGPARIQSIWIADDVDDQQIHGMRRRRQQKARTNTR